MKDMKFRDYDSFSVLNRSEFNQMIKLEKERIKKGWTRKATSLRLIMCIIDNIHRRALLENNLKKGLNNR